VPLPTDWNSLLAAVRALKAKGELPWAISIGNDSQGGRDNGSRSRVDCAEARRHSGKNRGNRFPRPVSKPPTMKS
jgi:hypothetical protein